MRRQGDGAFLLLVLAVAVFTLGLAFYFTGPAQFESVVYVDGSGSAVDKSETIASISGSEFLFSPEEEEADAATAGAGLLQEAVALRRRGMIHRAIGTLRDGLASRPDDPELMSELGSALITAGEQAEAIELLRHTVELAPEDARAFYNLGVALSGSGDAVGSLEAYREAIALRPNYARALYNAGMAALKIEDFETAKQMFMQASTVERSARSARTWFQLGSLYAREDRRAESVAAYREAIRLRPGYVEARNNLALELDQNGEATEAIAELERAARLEPGRASVQYNLGRLYRDAGRLEEASVRFGLATVSDPSMFRAFELHAEVLEGLGRHLELADTLEEMAVLRPDDGSICRRLGSEYRELRRYVESRSWLERALDLDPRLPDAWNELGIVFARTGDDRAALEAYHHALQLEPDRMSTRYNQGLALERLEEWDQAARSFERVLDQEPGHLDAREHLMDVILASGDTEQAVIEAGRLESLARDRPDVLRSIASVYSRSGRPDLAPKALQRSLELEPDNDVALFNLGVAYSKLDRYEDAIPIYEQFLARRPDHVNARRYLERAKMKAKE